MERLRLIRSAAADVIRGVAVSVLVAVAWSGQVSVYASSVTEDDPEVRKAVSEAVADTVYKVEVDWMYPMSHGGISLNDLYSITVMKDSLVSRLPYFGRAYSVPYGGGNGLMFEAGIKEYGCGEGRNGRKEISFSADSGEDHVKFHLTVFPDGSASISVISSNRQPISYSGRLTKIDENLQKK